MANCYDCGLPYDDPGFADLVVPDAVWLQIGPTGHEGGLLCPTCLVRAAEKAGIERAAAVFRSGPFCDFDRDDEIKRLQARVDLLEPVVQACHLALKHATYDGISGPLDYEQEIIDKAERLLQTKDSPQWIGVDMAQPGSDRTAYRCIYCKRVFDDIPKDHNCEYENGVNPFDTLMGKDSDVWTQEDIDHAKRVGEELHNKLFPEKVSDKK